MHFQTALRQTCLKRSHEGLGFLLVSTVNKTVIGIPTPGKVGICPRHPEIERVFNDPISPADIIVVSAAASGAGALEAADLVQSGIATRVAVFSDPPSGEDHEFIRRGLPDEAASQIRQLKSLGVTDVVQIPTTEAGTNDEAQALPPWCDQHQFRSIVLVTARDHSRRWRRVLDRVMKGHPTRVTVQPARYSKFDPDQWWKTRGGVRTEIIELQKLVLDAVLHPLSF